MLRRMSDKWWVKPRSRTKCSDRVEFPFSDCMNEHFLPTFGPGQEFQLPALVNVSLMYILTALGP